MKGRLTASYLKGMLKICLFFHMHRNFLLFLYKKLKYTRNRLSDTFISMHIDNWRHNCIAKLDFPYPFLMK